MVKRFSKPTGHFFLFPLATGVCWVGSTSSTSRLQTAPNTTIQPFFWKPGFLKQLTNHIYLGGRLGSQCPSCTFLKSVSNTLSRVLYLTWSASPHQTWLHYSQMHRHYHFDFGLLKSKKNEIFKSYLIDLLCGVSEVLLERWIRYYCWYLRRLTGSWPRTQVNITILIIPITIVTSNLSPSFLNEKKVVL